MNEKVLSLVIPVFNEKESLGPLLGEIAEVATGMPNRTFEVIFVDDGSRDGSWETIAALAAKNPWVRGLRFQRNFGKAAALNAGFRATTGDTVITLDADLQDDPHEIPDFLAKIDEGYDLVSGYKQVRNDPIYKVFPSRVFNWLVSTVTGVKLHDHNCGFKAYRSVVTKDVRLYGELHRYVPVLAASKGYKVGERVVNHRARKFGSSKFGFSRYLKGFLDLMQVKFTTRYGWRPMHFFGTLAFVAFFCAFASMGVAIILSLLMSSTWIGTLIALGASFTLTMIGSQALFSGFRAEAALNTRHGDPFIISEKNAMNDATASLRKSIYLLVGAVGVAVMVAKIVGAENVFEPSRYAPATEKNFGFYREGKPVRVWPKERPEPTMMFGSNDRSRWATIKALVDNGTYEIGRRSNFEAQNPPFDDKGIIFDDGYQSLDKVMNPATGVYYSSKPPLLSTLLAGEYWVLKKALNWSIDRDRWPVMATILITANVLPFVFYLILLAKVIEIYGTTDFGKLFAFVVASLGTFLTTFSMTLNNHSPAAYCVLFAVYPLLRAPLSLGGERGWGEGALSPLSLFLVGFFAALAAAFELPAAAFTAAIILPLLWLQPKRTLLFAVPGLLIVAAAWFACNYAALGKFMPAYGDFGGPWYDYPGSHWKKWELVKAGEFVPGIDFNQEKWPIYSFHLALGHHGRFSLTPAFFAAGVGLLMLSRRWIVRLLNNSPSPPTPLSPGESGAGAFAYLGAATLAISITVFAFYLTRTSSYNYGGNTSGPRWLFWLIPLWILGGLPAFDALGRTRLRQGLAAALLGFSVLSVFYPAWNPWRNPWMLQLLERTGTVNYDVKPK